MGLFDDNNNKIEQIYNLLSAREAKSYNEDLIIQFPSSLEEMQIAGGANITTLNRRINKKLMYVTVSIPENGIMEVYNNNMVKLFFCNESGTLQFPNGIWFEDMMIKLYNPSQDPARFNYRMIFAS